MNTVSSQRKFDATSCQHTGMGWILDAIYASNEPQMGLGGRVE